MSAGSVKTAMDPHGQHEPDEIAELVAAALDDSDGNIIEAADALADKLIQTPALVKEHLRDWARSWAYHRITDILAIRRKSIVRGLAGPTPAAGFQNALGAAVQSEFDRLMDMPLFGGKRLGDATAAEVRESAERYDTKAKDMARKARWQIAVAEAVESGSNGEDATVRGTLAEATLIRLWEEAGE